MKRTPHTDRQFKTEGHITNWLQQRCLNLTTEIFIIAIVTYLIMHERCFTVWAKETRGGRNGSVGLLTKPQAG